MTRVTISWDPQLQVAGMAFVGLQEFYNASVCLFHRTFGKLYRFFFFFSQERPHV